MIKEGKIKQKIIKQNKYRAGDNAQWIVKVTSDYLNLIHSTHIMKGKNQVLQIVL